MLPPRQTTARSAYSEVCEIKGSSPKIGYLDLDIQYSVSVLFDKDRKTHAELPMCFDIPRGETGSMAGSLSRASSCGGGSRNVRPSVSLLFSGQRWLSGRSGCAHDHALRIDLMLSR